LAKAPALAREFQSTSPKDFGESILRTPKYSLNERSP
jgi:hypothetical protein